MWIYLWAMGMPHAACTVENCVHLCFVHRTSYCNGIDFEPNRITWDTKQCKSIFDFDFWFLSYSFVSTPIQYVDVHGFLHKISNWNSRYNSFQAFLHISTLYSNCNRTFIAEKVYESDIGYEKVIEVGTGWNCVNKEIKQQQPHNRMHRIDRSVADIFCRNDIITHYRFMIHSNSRLF